MVEVERSDGLSNGPRSLLGEDRHLINSRADAIAQPAGKAEEGSGA